MISLSPNDNPGHTDLVFRVSGHHLPWIKTKNEIGVMKWIPENTTIFIPDVVAYDNSVDNPTTHEYTLLSCVTRATLSEVYQSLNDQRIGHFVDQLIDFPSQL